MKVVIGSDGGGSTYRHPDRITMVGPRVILEVSGKVKDTFKYDETHEAWFWSGDESRLVRSISIEGG